MGVDRFVIDVDWSSLILMGGYCLGSYSRSHRFGSLLMLTCFLSLCVNTSLWTTLEMFELFQHVSGQYSFVLCFIYLSF